MSSDENPKSSETQATSDSQEPSDVEPQTNSTIDEQDGDIDTDIDIDEIELDDIDTDRTNLEPQASPPPRQKLSGITIVVGLLLLFAIIVLGGAGYYWQQNVYQADLEILREQVRALSGAQTQSGANLEQSIAAAAEVAESAQAQAGSLGSKIDAALAAQNDLQRSVGALYEKETQTSVDWVLAETEYLVLAATQRLALERDVETAIAALRAADQRLRSAEHPDLIPIREQIIKDITALEGVNQPPVETLAIYLATEIGRVDDLPTKPIAEEVTPFSSTRAGEYAAEDWRRLGYAIWSDLVDLVEVKDADLPDSVLFDPELRYFLRQNLKIELASARLAVLRHDKGNLGASVDLINVLLENYYDTSHAKVKNLTKTLNEAKETDLMPAMPSITSSLDVIRKYRLARPANSGSAQ
ncbi:MAG: uroporphyrin-3 C-methyltransferase [Gammaproteobacteria bacterium]|jgi:uroporphyrin-3 C-methyltransferase